MVVIHLSIQFYLQIKIILLLIISTGNQGLGGGSGFGAGGSYVDGGCTRRRGIPNNDGNFKLIYIIQY